MRSIQLIFQVWFKKPGLCEPVLTGVTLTLAQFVVVNLQVFTTNYRTTNLTLFHIEELVDLLPLVWRPGWTLIDTHDSAPTTSTDGPHRWWVSSNTRQSSDLIDRSPRSLGLDLSRVPIFLLFIDRIRDYSQTIALDGTNFWVELTGVGCGLQTN